MTGRAMTRLTMGWLVLALTAPIGAQDGPAQETLPAAVREAQAVLLAAYPELAAARIAWRSTATDDGFELAAHAAIEPFEDPGEVPALVATRGRVDLDGRLQALAIEGALSGRARLRALQQRATEEPAAEVVRGAGGRFVPGDTVAASALLGATLARAAGGTRVADVTFDSVGAPDVEALTWRVEVDGPDGRRVLVFEPIEGRLLGLVRR